ncbi:GntR family transcriptional regulator [Actinomycetospora sp. C-140]
MTPPDTSRRIARPVPLRESVYEAILEMIVSRSLAPGQHLAEAELAATLGVSRQPVREALQWLKNDGWVELRPGYGAFVHAPTPQEAEQLLSVRSLLETEAARLAAANAAEADVANLRELWQRGVATVEADDRDGIVEANAEFHRAVTRASGNDVLIELAAQVDRRVRWYYASVAQRRGARSWDEHAALIEAIAAGDTEEASSVMRAHTEETRRSYLAAAEEDGVDASGAEELENAR